MLILTRRPHQVIVINGNIRVTVLGYERGQMRLGIEAPLDVTIDREEIWERKQLEQARDQVRTAVQTAVDGIPQP